MIQTLELKNFRSYSSGLFELKPGVNILVGANASGKTNLLEAIHVICTMHGFESSDRNLISFDQDWSRVEAMTSDSTRVMKMKSDDQNILEVDGIAKKKISDRTALPVVVFEPSHMLLLGNEPERRRAYVDGILSQIRPGYKQLITGYKRALAQRNRLLKSDSLNKDQLFVWDIQLCEKAGLIVAARKELVELLQDSAQSIYRSVSGHKETVKIAYASKIDTENYSESLNKYLKENLDLDTQRGFTGAGPHRDDIEILLRGKDARIAASRGEKRSLILTLKIIELKLVHEHSNKAPVFLLDDVFSELDGSRRRSLAKVLSEYQTFITTTDADVVIEHFSQCNIIPISSGQQQE